MAANGTNGKGPLLLFSSVPADGHFHPVYTIASHMAKRGYEVAFLTSPTFKDRVESIGAEWFPQDETLTPEVFGRILESQKLPFGIPRLTEELRVILVGPVKDKVKNLEATLAALRARDPNRQIIFIEDIINWTLYPFKHGRPLPDGWAELPRSIGVGVAPLLLDSIDTAPALMALPPDSTPSGRLRNEALTKLFREGPLKPLFDLWIEEIKGAGVTDMSGPQATGIFRSWYTAHDRTVQLCSPSMEYERSDLPPTLECIGVLKANPPKADLQYPPWWSDVSESKTGDKKTSIIFVTQGTTNPDVSELILPTINAAAGQENLLVVVALGMPGAALPEGIEIPANTRVIDYFPYDVILEHTDVCVSNGGYGSFGHAVRNAVPMVIAGEAQEKMEVAMRAEWAGMAINLRTQRPTPEQVRSGIESVLTDPKYKNAAVALRDENENLDAIAAFERTVKELTL